MSPRKIELLAPAKDLKCGIAAIDHGADAVYIGSPEFSARTAASNNLSDIEKLVGHAHQFGARVYVALNTVLNDQELERAVQLCHQLYTLGVDALIVQDMGLLESALPPLSLHASTQVNNRTVEKVDFLEKVGFEQVVLARELSLNKIREIHAATRVSLEFFVHGSLCVSYSGQCYISEAMTGRSANKGECAQFCRHSFTLRDGRGKNVEKDRYLLSLKDLDLSAHLNSLILAGISSFKIEGRLKDENYVKNVTASYRMALDAIIDGDDELERLSSGRCSFIFLPDSRRSFNRGKTEYFLYDKRNKPGAIDSPKSIGSRVGKVLRADTRSLVLDGDTVIENGDGLCYFNQEKKLVGVRVNRVEQGRIYPKDAAVIPVGTEVYRNHDSGFNKELARSHSCRLITLCIVLNETKNGLELTVSDEDGYASSIAIQVEKTVAKKTGAVMAMAAKQLRKSGGTIFRVDDVQVNVDPQSFYHAALLNDLRRKGLDNHLQERFSRYHQEKTSVQVNDYPWPSKELTYQDNITNQKAEKFYLRHGVPSIDRRCLVAKDVEGCALMTTKYCIKAQLEACPRMNDTQRHLVEPLTLVDNTGEYELGFDCSVCEMTVRRSKK